MKRVDDDTTTIRYMGTSDIARNLGVQRNVVSNWLARYEDIPAPDAMIGDPESQQPTYGWLPERQLDWQAWFEGIRQRIRISSKMTNVRRIGPATQH